MSKPLHRRTRCRLCDSPNLELAVPIKASPVADAYITADRLGQPQPLYPLDLYLCDTCGHLQNLDIVDPEDLFRDYLFTTSSSRGLADHFQAYAQDAIQRLGLPKSSLVVEIGSNDGTLLKFFKSLGMRVLGVDPAREIAQAATAEGVETIPDFFRSELAEKICLERGKASLICANNVFAHADDLADIVRGVHDLLADDGVFVFEVSYLVDIVDKFLFDTVYHEHVSYHSIGPLAKFFDRLDMQLFDVQHIPTKGGSIRGFAQLRHSGKRTPQPVVRDLTVREEARGFNQLPIYRDYAQQIARRRLALNEFLDRETLTGGLIAGYGASTTTTTLMWDFDLTRKLAFIADDNPKKYGCYCPGCHIPVVPSDELYVRRPDVVVVLAWQYAAPILKRHERFMREGGRFAIPLPELRIVDSL